MWLKPAPGGAGLDRIHQACNVISSVQARRDGANLGRSGAAAIDLTLSRLCEWLHAEHHIGVAASTLWKMLVRMDITIKKFTVRCARSWSIACR